MYRTIIVIMSIIILLDQFIKKIIVSIMDLNTSYTVINNFFHITYVQNNGAAFSMFEGNRLFLITIAVLSLALIIYMLVKDQDKKLLNKVSYGLLIGGIIGNLIDRVFLGYVIDYLHFDIFSYSFPVFNLADIGIVVGIGLMLIQTIRSDKNE